MKKSVLIGLGVIVVIVVSALIFIPKETKLPFSETGSNGSNSSSGESKFIGYGSTSEYNNGYFYIKDLSNIMYFDYDTKKEVYLCNKPNCKHDNDACSSYVDVGANNELFYYDGHLYLTTSSASTVQMNLTDDGAFETTTGGDPTTIYKMNLDGTNKEKVFTAPSGTEMTMPFIINGNKLYGILKKSGIEKDKSGYNTIKTTSEKIIVVNLDSGKHEEIMDGKDKSFVGVYDGKLVIQEINYLKDPDSFGDDTEGFVENLYNSKSTIKLIDPNTKKEDTIFEGLFKEIENLKVYKDGVYFIGNGSRNLEYINLSTKKREVMKELPKKDFSISTIADDKILVYTYKDKDAHLGEAYSIDLKTKEMDQFSLKDKNEYLIEILSSNDDYYFVQIEYEFGEEYTTWAGTKQQDIIGISYGLIKKSDYWASKANYIKMKNAK